MSDAVDLFIEEARGVSVVEAALIIGVPMTTKNHAGPCPICGGKDRFSISPSKQAWNCRQCGKGGKDGISLIAHAYHYDTSSRTGFLAACSDSLQRSVPHGGETESESDRRARLDRIDEQKRRNADRAAANEKQQNDFRQREIDRSRGIYLKAPEQARSPLPDYLSARTGFRMAPGVFLNLRCDPRATYWHGKDDRGFERSHFVGPAMIAPFVDLSGRITGCHQTWIDMANAPKFRPDLGEADDGTPLPTKKMRGSKKGSIIPLFGLMTSRRWVGGEGIENGLAIAGAEGFRSDTFYFAAGDLGNLAGPADTKSSFSHPDLKKIDARGRQLSIRVAGPDPKPNQGADEAMQVADHVDHLILLADGDSEIWFTAAAMARAEKRLTRDDRVIETWWPPERMDFAALMAGQ
jgi:hypothetical protein